MSKCQTVHKKNQRQDNLVQGPAGRANADLNCLKEKHFLTQNEWSSLMSIITIYSYGYLKVQMHKWHVPCTVA